MKYTFKQIALLLALFQKGNHLEYAQMTDAIYMLVGLGDPVDLALAIDFVDQVVNFDSFKSPAFKNEEQKKFAIEKTLWHAKNFYIIDDTNKNAA